MPIITDPTQYTPVNQLVTQVINAAWDQANTKTAAYEAKILAAVGNGGFLDTAAVDDIAADTVSAPSIIEPGVNIPASAAAEDVFDEYKTQYLELVALLSDKFTAFRNTYFPDESATYVAAESWLKEAIQNPSAGIPSAISDQIWDDDRSRILSEAGRAIDDVTASFAAKGFPIPPGALSSAVLKINQKAQDQVAESSRKVSVMSIDMMKFAIEKAINLRQVAVSAAVDYIKALASGPDMASRMVNVGYDAQSKLISAASQFYGARIEAAKLTSDVSRFNVSTKLQADEKNQLADLTLIEDKLKALLGEAASLAQMATSLFNNIHASAGVSGSRSNSVGFSYSNDTSGAAPTTTDVF